MTILGITTVPPAEVTVIAAPYAPAGPIVAGTSATGNDIGVGGTFVFAMEQIGLGFTPGLRVRASVSDDAATWVEGIVSDFDGINLTIISDLTHGTGVHDSWNVGIAGEPGQKGQKGDTGAQGPIGPGGGVPADSPTFTGDPKAPTPIPGDNDNSIATTQFVQSALVNYQRFDPDLQAISALTGEGVIYYRSAPDTWAAVTIGTGITFTGGTLSAGGMAPLDSPIFTGNPTAPTPTAGDADTSIATTGFVAASFAPIASPIFTGTPKAPSPAPGTNDTSLATTAYVQDALTTGYQPLDADLTALAALTGTNVFFYRSAANTWAPVTIGANMLFSGGTLSATGTSGGGGVPADSPVFTGDPQAPTPPPGDNDASIATSAFVQNALGGYAPLASPSFSGAPLAPTPAPGDNTTKIATTAYAVNLVASYAPLASPAFTGTPTAPTPATADNTTKIATTAMVQAALAASGFAPLANPTFTGDPKAPTLAKTDNDTSLATTAHVKLVVADYAPLASPALTGAPTAPTQAVGDNSSNIATTSFVKAQGYAPLASPSFSGTPTAPTPSLGDSTTKIATTAFVQAASGGPGTPVLINEQTVSTAVAAVNFTSGIDATYDEYEIHFWNVRFGTAGQNLWMRVSENNGSTWATASYNWVTGYLNTTPAFTLGGSDSDSKINLYSQSVFPFSSASITQQGIIRFAQPASTTARKHFLFDLCGLSDGGSENRHVGSGTYSGSTGAINGVSIFPSGNNFLSGTFKLFGIKK